MEETARPSPAAHGEAPETQHLSAIIADYRQRCEDFRRQVSYYPKLVVIIVGVISTSLVWVLDADSRNEASWILPMAVIICELVACFAIYVHWSSGVMRQYITNIELYLVRLIPAHFRLHSVDAGPEPEIGLGFHYWSSMNPLLKRRLVIRSFVGMLVAGAFLTVLAAMWIWGQASPVYASPILSGFARWTGLGLPFLGVGLLLWAKLIVLKRLKPIGLESPADTPSLSRAEMIDLLTVDFEERNADYRALIDNYPLFLTLLITILAGSASLLLRGNAQWVHVFTPFLMVTIPYFIIQTYRRGKALRWYLVQLEMGLDELVSSAGILHVTRPRWSARELLPWGRRGVIGQKEGFRIGFFRVIRERLWQKTSGSSVMLVNAGVAAAVVVVYLPLLAWMAVESHHWLMTSHADLVTYHTLGTVGLAVLLISNLVLYFEAGRVLE